MKNAAAPEKNSTKSCLNHNVFLSSLESSNFVLFVSFWSNKPWKNGASKNRDKLVLIDVIVVKKYKKHLIIELNDLLQTLKI